MYQTEWSEVGVGSGTGAGTVDLTSSTLDSAVLLEGMRAGAKEFLAQPIQKKEVEDAFKRFFERFNGGNIKNDRRKKAGKVMAFFGGKGGVGTTSIAVNLAAALVNLPTKPSVVLVDVNQHGGDLPIYLDLQPNHSFRDIASDLTRLDHAFLIRVLTKCENGLQVLSQEKVEAAIGAVIFFVGAGDFVAVFEAGCGVIDSGDKGQIALIGSVHKLSQDLQTMDCFS